MRRQNYSRCSRGFEVYSGDDNLTLPLLAVGAVGVISVAALVGTRIRGNMDAWEAGKADEARQINAPGESTMRPATARTVPTKAMMRTLGLPVGEPFAYGTHT